VVVVLLARRYGEVVVRVELERWRKAPLQPVRTSALQWQQLVYTSPEYALFLLLFSMSVMHHRLTIYILFVQQFEVCLYREQVASIEVDFKMAANDARN
jgi:hypothetical protein